MIIEGTTTQRRPLPAASRPIAARRYIATETAINVVVNTLVTTFPALLIGMVEGDYVAQPTHAFIVAVAPQALMGAFMSSLVPSLLTRRRHKRNRLDVRWVGARATLPAIVAMAVALAAAYASLVLGVIHFLLPPLFDGSIGWATSLCLGGAQAALAGTLVTPVALSVLFLGSAPRWRPDVRRLHQPCALGAARSEHLQRCLRRHPAP